MTRVGRRLAVVGAVVVVLLLTAALAVRTYAARHLQRAIERFEAEAGSLDLATYAPPEVEDRRENAALWLRAGADAMLWTPDQERFLTRRIASLGQSWPAEDDATFVALLADHDAARRLLDRAAPLERSSFEVEYRNGSQADIPDFLALLRAGRLLTVECDFRQQRGDVAGALASLHLLERLTAAQRTESLLIALLAGAATERLYHDRLDALLQQVDDPVSLLALRRDLEHLDSVTASPRRPFAAEAALSLPWVLGENAGLELLADPPMQARWKSPVDTLYAAIGVDREVAALLLENSLRVIETLERPTAAMTEEEFMASVRHFDTPVPLAAPIASVTTVAVNFFGPIQRAQWNESARALARLAVELRLSRAGHGHYPTELADLPTSAATGETATYVLFDDGSVEVAFPEAEASFRAAESKLDKSGKISVRDSKLRWRLVR